MQPLLNELAVSKANNTPRGYLSWNQLSMWEKDPNQYYQIYVEGIDFYRTKYLEFGSKIHEAIEKGRDYDKVDPLLSLAVSFLPQYPLQEYTLLTKYDDIPLLGRLDAFHDGTLIFADDKTGKRWTQGMTDKSGQITFYYLMLWLLYKKMPPCAYIHHLKTFEDTKGDIHLTGDVSIFKTQRTRKDIILMQGRIKKAWRGIGEMGKMAGFPDKFLRKVYLL